MTMSLPKPLTEMTPTELFRGVNECISPSHTSALAIEFLHELTRRAVQVSRLPRTIDGVPRIPGVDVVYGSTINWAIPVFAKRDTTADQMKNYASSPREAWDRSSFADPTHYAHRLALEKMCEAFPGEIDG